jgi:uncharacterized membrane protein
MSEPEAAPATADTIVGISFGDAFRAQEFLTASYRLVSQHNVELLDAVMISKDATGRTTVRETVDPQPGTSALRAGVWTGLLGLFLAGPIGWLAGAAVGAGAGAVRAKIVDVGVPDEWVAWFRDAVQPNTVTVVLLLGELNRAAVMAELERFAGARLVYANVAPDVVQRIRDALGDPATGPLTAPAEASPSDQRGST